MIGDDLTRAARRRAFLRRIRQELIDLGEEPARLDRLSPLALVELRATVTARLMRAPAGR